MTADEFLLWPGDGTRRRFHLIDGDVRAMSPASSTHSVVQGNLAYLMGAAVRQQAAGLHVATEAAVIPALAARNNVRVPDLVVIRGRTGQGEIAVPDPVAVVEILSPGNASTTRENIRACATLTSVREMAVVSTSGMEVEVHRRDAAGAWPPSPAPFSLEAALSSRASVSIVRSRKFMPAPGCLVRPAAVPGRPPTSHPASPVS